MKTTNQAFELPQTWGNILVIVAILATLLTLVYTFLTGIRIFFGPLKNGLNDKDISDPPRTMSLLLLALAMAP